MQVMGWISILTGLLHYRKVAGILLIIIGMAIVYAVWKSKNNETELTYSVFLTRIIMIRKFKKAPKVAMEEVKSDFLIKALPKPPHVESKAKKIQKPDWFIYTK